MRNQIIQGSVMDPGAWERIPKQHVQCCITSPPYWGLRDYGIKGQLGLEKTPEEYAERMVQVFRYLWRALRDDGTLWLNLGDSYNGSRQTGGTKSISGHGASQPHGGAKKNAPGLKPKDLCGIPWRVALALQSDGWYLRQDIIWSKPNPMPESVRDRCTKAHEYLFLLAKKPRHYCDMEAIKEPTVQGCNSIRNRTGNKCNRTPGSTPQGYLLRNDYPTRNKRSVWTIPTAPYSEAHFATFPPRLIEPCVLAGTSEKGCCPECGTPWKRVVKKTDTGSTQKMADGWDTGAGGHGTIHRSGREAGEGGKPVMANITTGWQPECTCVDGGGAPRIGPVPCIVFDPFMGSGTTGMVAKMHGRDYLGIELNSEYIELIEKRIGGVKK